MDINNPQSFDHMITSTGEVLRVKLVDIGVWNMDLSQTKNVAHGLSYLNILSVKAMIRDDAELYGYNFGGARNFDLVSGTGAIVWNDTNIILSRSTGGVFDRDTFDDAVMNRGKITICYIDV